MKTKLIIFPLLLCTFLLTASLTCFAEQPPRRIAIVPTVSQTKTDFPEVKAYCDNELYQNLRIPLNGFLNLHEYIGPDDIAAALPELSEKNKLHKFTASRLKDAADQLNADLIIGFVLTDIGETRHANWDGEIILYSYVNMELIGYDRRKDTFIKYRDNAYFHDEESSAGHVLNLSKSVADKLLKKADLRKDIFPLSQKIADTSE